MRKFNRSSAALATALLATALILGGCADEAPAPGPAATNANTASTAPAATNDGVIQGPAPKPGDPGLPPLDMKDTIEGRVIGILCYKKNPEAPPVEAKACALQNLPMGGALGVLTEDGTIYINDKDVRTNNKQLEFFVGEIVTVQGQTLADPEPGPGWEGLKVKKFNMKLVRRKGAPAEGTPRQMNVPQNKNAAR